jgi:hypothetical protein
MALVLALACTIPAAHAQDADSISAQDTKQNLKRSPLKASLYSAVLPGTGQIYNRKYWKAPIVYAGMGTFIYLAVDNHQEFMRFKSALVSRQNEEPDEFEGILSEGALLNEMERWQRYRDLSIIGASVFYVLQIIDANVDATLSDFDVSEDLSLKLKPVNSPYSQTMAMSLTLKF